MDEAIRGYVADAPNLVAAFESLRTEEVLASVLDLLPRRPRRALEIGAGTGRDAAWLGRKGHTVLASEPAAPLREAGIALHPELRWLDDSLPHLRAVSALGERFGLILLVGVWQHLPPEEHAAAIAALVPLLDPGGRLILSLRHGPGAPGRPCFAASPAAIRTMAEAEGLRLLAERQAESIQPANRAAGVTWTWLAFEAATAD
jgi:SAM-dependent methyltransferase